MSFPCNIILETPDSLTAFVGMGANLPSRHGGPLDTLKATIQRLKANYSWLVCSSFYVTEAVDCAEGTADFINAVIAMRLDSDHRAMDLLFYLQELEDSFGSTCDKTANAPRTLDLDILWYGTRKSASPRLTIPHPRAAKRRFVMQPLVEIAPTIVLPGQVVTAQELLKKLPLTPGVTRIS